MANNLGAKVAFPALATAANMAEQHKKGRAMYQDDHLKERATTNKIKHKSGEKQTYGARSGRGGAAELFP